MSNRRHVAILRRGAKAWNKWRATLEDPPDLSGADLRGFDLTEANLGGANMANATLIDVEFRNTNLSNANLDRAKLAPRPMLHASHLRGAKLTGLTLDHVMLEGMDLMGIDFSGSSLREADLSKTNLMGARLKRANLRGARLNGADLRNADLRGADLRAASLERATLLKTNLTRAKLQGSRVWGLSAWDVTLTNANQANLVITRHDQAEVTVDDLEVAQFVYLLINNERIRAVIDTVTSKVVLILGNFAPSRKRILDALRAALRREGYVPIVFDSDKALRRNLQETVSTLAHMARFIIADLTDSRSVAQELGWIVPKLSSVPVQPLILRPQKEYAMFESLRDHPWVLPTFHYSDQRFLLKKLRSDVIAPAERRLRKIQKTAN
jgi:uncharacterized protein YjbI with pentapeptide repeats